MNQIHPTHPSRRYVAEAAAWLVASTGLFALPACTITTGQAADPCAKDAAVASCIGDAVGYSCSGTATPEQGNAELACGAGFGETNGRTDYCCDTRDIQCHVDATIPGRTGGTTGYACTGGQTPPESDPSLSCGGGTPDNAGVIDYCCSGGADSCVADASVMGCTNGAAGYTCTGAETPEQIDSTLSCSTGTPTSGKTIFCCVPLSVSSCMEDSSVQGCLSTSMGFSCTGSDTPTDANASLVCSAGTPSNGATLYCCSS